MKTIYLDRPLPDGSALAGKRPTRDHWPEPRLDRCLALHPVGFSLPDDSRRPRCALTAPFHPYPPSPAGRGQQGLIGGRYIFCGTFPYTPRGSHAGNAGGRYPPPWFSGARTFLSPARRERPSSCRPTGHYTNRRDNGLTKMTGPSKDGPRTKGRRKAPARLRRQFRFFGCSWLLAPGYWLL